GAAVGFSKIERSAIVTVCPSRTCVATSCSWCATSRRLRSRRSNTHDGAPRYDHASFAIISATQSVSTSLVAPMMARERHSRRCVDSHSLCRRTSSQTLAAFDAPRVWIDRPGSEPRLISSVAGRGSSYPPDGAVDLAEHVELQLAPHLPCLEQHAPRK